MAFNAFAFAWNHAHKVPAPLFRGALNLAADITWLLKKGGVQQLERNLGRIAAGHSSREIRKLSRQSMRSYFRYFGEAFVLTHLTPAQVDARVRTIGEQAVKAAIDSGNAPVLALSHQGNWDLAGVWASRHLSPVLTVAERLKPEEVFQDFLRFRQALGMTILAAGDNGVFRALLRAAHGQDHLICLLADRDLSASGVEVDFFGETARFAAGPAVLAVGSQAPLFAAGIRYEKLTGQRRKQAGSPWGIVITFHPEIPIDRTLPKSDQIAHATQSWANDIAASIDGHPQDWHMLQKVFINDLDPDRYAKTLAKETDGTA